MNITNVALGFAGVEFMEIGQRSIEGFFKNPTTTSDTPRSPDSGTKRKRDPRDDPQPETSLTRSGPHTQQHDAPADEVTSFLCGRCGKRIALPSELTDANVGAEIRTKALVALRMEHDDFHVAQDLAKQYSVDGSPRKIRPIEKPQTKKTKRRETPEGIAKFFNKK